MSSFDTHAAADRSAHSAYVGAQPASAATQSLLKRMLDIFLAGGALLIFAPLLLVIAALIWVDSPGPALFRQKRTGLGGKPFTILKFRTMRVQEQVGDVRQASLDDDRVTRIGAILRRLSLDELPQLLNIVAGDMSLIGPRPHAISHDEAWSKIVPRYNERFRVKPGLSGYAQISGYRGEVHSQDCIRKRIEADNHYVENWSLSLDVKILALTIRRCFKDPNAY